MKAGDVNLKGVTDTMKKRILAFSAVLMILASLFAMGIPASAASTPKANYKYNAFSKYIEYRQPLTHTYTCLTQKKELNVVYFGGSVTAGYGSNDGSKYSWRALSGKWLQDNFPQAKINLMNTAIGANGTFLGTYRVQRDVIALKPDLLFLEYAINDRYGAFDEDTAALQCETIVREVKQALPKCDIVMLLVIDDSSSKLLPNLYPTAAGHAKIAKAYNIPVVNVGRSLVESMNNPNDSKEWAKYYIDIVHPTDAGYKKYYDCLEEYLKNVLQCTDYTGVSDTAPALPKLQSTHLLDGDRKLVVAADKGMDAYIVKDETKNFRLTDKEEFFHLEKTPYIGYWYVKKSVSDSQPTQITLRFKGTDLAIWTNFYAGSMMLCSVDGGRFKSISGDKNGPTRLVQNAASGEHTVVLKPTTYGSDTGNVMKIGALLIRDAAKQTLNSSHKHSFGEWKTVRAATDDADGWEERTCSCWFTEGRTIPAGTSEPEDPWWEDDSSSTTTTKKSKKTTQTEDSEDEDSDNESEDDPDEDESNVKTTKKSKSKKTKKPVSGEDDGPMYEYYYEVQAGSGALKWVLIAAGAAVIVTVAVVLIVVLAGSKKK